MLSKKIIIISISILVLLLSACTNERISQTNENTSSIDTIDSISTIDDTPQVLVNSNQKKYKIDLLENLSVDTEIENPDVSSAPVLKAKNKIFDQEKLCKILFSNNDIQALPPV